MAEHKEQHFEMKLIPGISDTYTGVNREYPQKELWFDTTVFGGHLNAASIVKGNGGADFDIDAFINSEEGELLFNEFKYELCIYGNMNWNHPDMVKLWKSRGILQKSYKTEDKAHEIVVFAPDDLEPGRTYPLIIDFHGGGGTIFEAINHGFVRTCKQYGYMVMCPEAEGTATRYCADHIGDFIDFAVDAGYPVDRTRVYLVGHSMGCVASVYGALSNPGLVAAIAPHSGAGVFDSDMHFLPLTEELYAASGKIPMYLEAGEHDAGQLPMNASLVQGLNRWLQMNGCRAAKHAENRVGIDGDVQEVRKIHGLEYTFIDFIDRDGDPSVRIVGVENMPHWISYAYPDLAWDFLKKYKRTADGQLLIIDPAPDGCDFE